jgi:heme exporter protein D
MIWNSPAEFFAMGGYGLYVWGSYAVALMALLLEPRLVAARHRRALEDVAARTSSED